MTPAERELALYAKIEKLEKALAIAKESLLRLSVRICENLYPGADDIAASRIVIKEALEKIDKELGE